MLAQIPRQRAKFFDFPFSDNPVGRLLVGRRLRVSLPRSFNGNETSDGVTRNFIRLAYDSDCWVKQQPGEPSKSGAAVWPQPRSGWLSWRPALRIPRVYARRSVRPVLLATALSAACSVGVAAWHVQHWPGIAALRARMEGVAIVDAAGRDGGVLVRSDGLTTHDGAGKEQPRLTMTVGSASPDFMRAARGLEGEGILGVNLFNMGRAGLCMPFAKFGMDSFGLLRLKNGRCGGGSTLAAQSIRALTAQDDGTASRKFAEALNAISLNLHFMGDSAGYDRFLSDTLDFGYSEGKPVYGERIAARVMFGKAPQQLRLFESAELAAALLYPFALSCGPARAAGIARFELIRQRARYALDRSFRNDSRYAAERLALDHQAPITSPTLFADALASGHSNDDACRAGAHPVLQFDALSSSAHLAAQSEIKGLEDNGFDVREIRLETTFASQASFKARIEKARQTIAREQAGHWLVSPATPDTAVLAFAARPEGGLLALYDSTGLVQLHRLRDLGSLSKIPALAFLAEMGWAPDRRFCNKEVQGLHNAHGEPQPVKECVGDKGWMTAETAFGKSVSLAVYDALRQYPRQLLARRMSDWGITLPQNSEPAYDLAFGLAQTTPAHMAGYFSAVSSGIDGKPAIGYEPTVVNGYRSGDASWRRPPRMAIDLRSVFALPSARLLVAQGARGAFQAGGTLSKLGLATGNNLGKTGTLDDDNGNVRFKGVAGASAGRVWFAMLVPQQKALGDGTISIIPLAQELQEALHTEGR